MLGFLTLVGLPVPAKSAAQADPVPAAYEQGESALDDEFDLELEQQPAGFPDPLEPLNRRFLKFNRAFDFLVLDPLNNLYRFLLPDLARTGIHRVFRHLSTPSILVNDVLQGEGSDAGTTLARFVLNTIFGVGGTIDAADTMGYVGHKADFGQTLARYGVASGPYLVLPIFGPSNVRDGAGTVVDAAFQPTTYLVGPAERLFIGGSSGLATRDAHRDAMNALKESSVDYYAALRNAYYQNRMSEIWARYPEERVAAMERARYSGSRCREELFSCQRPPTGRRFCSRGWRAPHRDRCDRTLQYTPHAAAPARSPIH
jgi:phospholipid-binding lipoprotein MlaA